MPLLKESYGQIFDGNGDPYPGAKIWTYDEGTTTPKSSYTTRALSVANANPVVSDGNGRFPAIWLSTGRYKIVAMTSANVTIYTADGIEGSDAAFSVLTTRGDMLTRDATTAVRLAIGTAGQFLSSNGTDPVWSAGTPLNGNNTWTGNNTFQLTDDGAGPGPDVSLSRVSASPAASDGIGRFVFYGRDSAGNAEGYAVIKGNILDPASGSEDGSIGVDVAIAGAIVPALSISQGILVGPTVTTGGLMGTGSVNAAGYYLNGAAMPFTKTSLVNAGVLSLGGALNVAHGLGTKPLIVFLYLKCLGAEHGYSIGHEVVLPMASSNNNRTAAVLLDATNVSIRVGTDTVQVIHLTTGAVASITLASWDLYVRSIA